MCVVQMHDDEVVVHTKIKEIAGDLFQTEFEMCFFGQKKDALDSMALSTPEEPNYEQLIERVSTFRCIYNPWTRGVIRSIFDYHGMLISLRGQLLFAM